LRKKKKSKHRGGACDGWLLGMTAERFFFRYFGSTMLYGGLHFGSRAPEYAEFRHEFTGETKKHRMLLMHYAGRVMHGQILGICMWPVMLYDDLTYLECRARGKNPADYGSALRVLTR
jgi:hypothetical protein